MKTKKPLSLSQPANTQPDYQAFLAGAPDVQLAQATAPLDESVTLSPSRGRPKGEALPPKGKLFRFTPAKEAQLAALQRRMLTLLVRNVTATEVVMAGLDALERLSDDELRRLLG